MEYIDLSGIDGLTDELASKIQERAKQSIENRAQAEATVKAKELAVQLAAKQTEEATKQFDAAKADFKLKMDAMDAKLKAKESDPSKPSAREQELEGVLAQVRIENEQLRKGQDDLRKEKEAKELEIESLARDHLMDGEINIYNAHATKTAADAKPDLIAYLKQEMKGRLTTIDGKIVPTHRDGTPMYTHDGFATMQTLITAIRQEKPSLFNHPTGSGATGQNQSGSANKPLNQMTEAERVAAYKENPAQFAKAANL